MGHIAAVMGQNATVLGIHVHIWLLVLAGAIVIAALGLVQHSH